MERTFSARSFHTRNNQSSLTVCMREKKRRSAWEAICNEGESNDSEDKIFIHLNSEEKKKKKNTNHWIKSIYLMTELTSFLIDKFSKYHSIYAKRNDSHHRFFLPLCACNIHANHKKQKSSTAHFRISAKINIYWEWCKVSHTHTHVWQLTLIIIQFSHIECDINQWMDLFWLCHALLFMSQKNEMKKRKCAKIF